MQVYDKNTKKTVTVQPQSFEYTENGRRYMKVKLTNGSRTDNYSDVVIKWSEDRQGWFIPEKKSAKKAPKPKVK